MTLTLGEIVAVVGTCVIIVGLMNVEALVRLFGGGSKADGGSKDD